MAALTGKFLTSIVPNEAHGEYGPFEGRSPFRYDARYT